MNRLRKSTGLWLSLVLVVLLASCHLPSLTEVPTAATEPPVSEVVFELGPGTSVRWVDSSSFVYVPPGEFIMGEDEETASDHAPAHTVRLDGFWIHQAEVTNQMYAACVAAGVCSPPDQAPAGPYASSRYSNHPVVNVDWNQAEAYCEWILGRLPTEAEWEKAARGEAGEPFPWGDADPACDLLNAQDCLDPVDTSPVRDYFPGASPYELADTAGNVFEWVFDWYDEDFYAVSPAERPTGPAQGEERVFRGSSYQTSLDQVAAYLRNHIDPLEQLADLGFRCVLSGETVGNPPPPPCEVAGYLPPADPDDGPTITPSPYVINSYCRPFDGGVITPINIVFDQPIDADYYIVSSPLGAVSCTVDPAFPEILTCSGLGLPEGVTLDVTICSALGSPPLPDVDPSCPPEYYWNELALACRHVSRPPIDVDCGPGYFLTDDYGCVPLAGGINADECPIGFGAAVTFIGGHERHICIPPDGDAYCEDNPSCSSNQTCTAGTFVPEDGCCELPEDVPFTCELGYHFNVFLGVCEWEGTGESNCVTQTVSLPECEDTPPDRQVPCSSYSDLATCSADPRCQWHPFFVSFGGYCEVKP